MTDQLQARDLLDLQIRSTDLGDGTGGEGDPEELPFARWLDINTGGPEGLTGEEIVRIALGIERNEPVVIYREDFSFRIERA